MESRVRYEDCVAHRIGSLVQEQSSRLCGFMLQYTEGFPLKLAPLAKVTQPDLEESALTADVDEDQDVTDKDIAHALSEAADDIAAWHSALRGPDPKLIQMAQRSAIGRPFNLWCVAFLLATKCECVIRPLRVLLRRHLCAYIHSLHNEKVHKRMKAVAIREAPNQLIKGVRLWNEMVDSKVLEESNRQTVEVNTFAPPPPDADMEKLFHKWSPQKSETLTDEQRAEQEMRLKFKAKTKSLVGTNGGFDTFNPTSQQEAIAEHLLFKAINRNKKIGENGRCMECRYDASRLSGLQQANEGGLRGGTDLQGNGSIMASTGS